MKNLVFFLSFIVLTVVAWNKDKFTANSVLDMSTQTISFTPPDSSVELTITMTNANRTTNSDQAWVTLSSYSEITGETPIAVYVSENDSTTPRAEKITFVVRRDKNKLVVNLLQKAPSSNLINPATSGAREMSRTHLNWEKGCMDDKGMGLSFTSDDDAVGNRQITSLVASADEGRYPY